MTKMFKFGFSKGSGEDVSPVEIAVHFKDAKSAIFNIILEMMKFQRYVLGAGFKVCICSC